MSSKCELVFSAKLGDYEVRAVTGYSSRRVFYVETVLNGQVDICQCVFGTDEMRGMLQSLLNTQLDMLPQVSL